MYHHKCIICGLEIEEKKPGLPEGWNQVFYDKTHYYEVCPKVDYFHGTFRQYENEARKRGCR